MHLQPELLIVSHLAPRALALAVLALGCSNSEPSGREVGVIDPGPAGGPVIVAPDTVRKNLPFSAVINSFGSSSCTIPDGASIRQTAALAQVVPFDIVAPELHPCTRDFGSRPHPVTIVFSTVGSARIEAQGRSTRSAGDHDLITISKSIVVIEP